MSLSNSETQKPTQSYYQLLLPVFQFLWACTCLEDRHYRVPWDSISIGHWPQLVPDLFLIGSAITVLLIPGSVEAFSLLCIFSLFTTIHAWPVLANDSLLILSINVILLGALLPKLFRKEKNAQHYLSEIPSAALAVLSVTYLAAGFHKLNGGFFDPLGSCVRRFLEFPIVFRQLPNWHLPGNLIFVFAVLTVLLEFALPFLLYSARTRGFALFAGAIFHLCIAMQIDTFSGAVFSLYLLFLPVTSLRALFRFTGSDKGKNIKFALRSLLALFMIFFLWAGRNGPGYPSFLYGRLAWTISATLAIAWVVARTFRNRPNHFFALPKPPRPILLSLILGALALNCLGPFVGFRSTLSFSMFSNLRVEGESNHWLIPHKAFQVFSEGDDLVTILWTDVPALKHRGAFRWAIPRLELSRVIAHELNAGNDKLSLFVKYRGKLDWIQLKDPGIYLGQDIPAWKRLFFSYRAVPPADVNICLW